MSQYASQISTIFEKSQLDLINLKAHHQNKLFNKHKAIWWEHVNAKKTMTRVDFIQQQNIVYLD
jgi:hypothetical protein